MFSYYEKGITSQQMDNIITMDELVQLIKDNPNKDSILKIWRLPYKSDEYKKHKQQLPSITTAGIFNGKKVADRIFKLSGYQYFDIDAADMQVDPKRLKKHILEKHSDKICLISRSVGGRGLCFFIKVNGLSKENYKVVYDYFQKEVFSDLKTDNNAKGLHRSLFIPYDPEIYYKNIELEIPKDLEEYQTKKETLPVKKNIIYGYTGNVHLLPISVVLDRIRLETRVDVGNRLFKIETVPYLKIFIPKAKIENGKKHATFRAVTEGIVFLNPDIDLLTVQSYISYINQNRTVNPMDRREMLRTVKHAYDKLKETGQLNIVISKKTIHINKRAILSKPERLQLASKLSGLLKAKESILKINNAITTLNSNGKKITRKEISKISGLSLKTIQRHFGRTIEEIDSEIEGMNYKII